MDSTDEPSRDDGPERPHVEIERPYIPREAWEDHPHFPAQVLLLGSHENFRRVNRYLVEEVVKPGSVAGLQRLYASWISGMRSHEAYEEHKLYPYLARRWGVSFDAAAAGHDALHEVDHVVRAAFAAAGRTPEPDARAALAAALARHERVLLDHLALEEDLVIPLLLALDPAEFDDYCHSSIGRLLAGLATGARDAG